jgi:hypothetical protein
MIEMICIEEMTGIMTDNTIGQTTIELIQEMFDQRILIEMKDVMNIKLKNIKTKKTTTEKVDIPIREIEMINFMIREEIIGNKITLMKDI